MGRIIEFPWHRTLEQVLPVVQILRHGDKQGANGPLSGKGVMEAHRKGFQIAENIRRNNVVSLFTGDADRVEQTGAIIEQQLRLADIPVRREKRPELSSRSIFLTPKSELLQAIKVNMCNIADKASDREKDTAIGQLLIKWMDTKEEETDRGTMSFAMAQKIHAYYLDEEMTKAREKFLNHEQIAPVIKITHEIQAFILQTLTYSATRRGKRKKGGQDIVRENKGITPFLEGPEICLVSKESGDVKFRMRIARFDKNGKKNGYYWYEVDEPLVERLANEVIPLDSIFFTPEYENNNSLILRTYRNLEKMGWPVKNAEEKDIKVAA